MTLLVRFLVVACGVLLATKIIPGVHVASFGTALWVTFFLGLLNLTLRPLLVVLTLPISLLTLGLFTLVINAAMVMVVGSVVKGFTVETFGAAFLMSLFLTIISWVAQEIIHA